MRHPVVCLLVLAAAGCGSDDTTIDQQFDVCEPIGLDVTDANADQRQGVADAIALWRERGVATVTDQPVVGSPTIPVVFEQASPAFYGYYDDEAAVIYVNIELDDEPVARAITIAHELGHAFGLYHVERGERVSLMNPHNLTTPPTEDDVREVERLWGPCGPVPTATVLQRP